MYFVWIEFQGGIGGVDLVPDQTGGGQGYADGRGLVVEGVHRTFVLGDRVGARSSVPCLVVEHLGIDLRGNREVVWNVGIGVVSPRSDTLLLQQNELRLIGQGKAGEVLVVIEPAFKPLSAGGVLNRAFVTGWIAALFYDAPEASGDVVNVGNAVADEEHQGPRGAEAFARLLNRTMIDRAYK